MSPRRLAASVLVRVARDDAYVAAALSSALDRNTPGHVLLDPRDRGLATELTYGVVRTRAYLLRRLEEFGKLKASDHVLVSHLLVAAYQIEFLDRVPVSAAVNEAVSAITEDSGRHVGGFANAILRRLSQSRDPASSLRGAIVASTPSWIRKRVTRAIGEDEFLALVAPMSPPRPCLRVNQTTVTPEFAEFLRADCEAVPGVEGAFRYERGGDPRKRSEFHEGKFLVQELGAQLVAHAAGVKSGDQVLDVCAGRGQKTSLFAELAGSAGRVVATDLHEHKLSALQAEATRLNFSIETRLFDWTNPPPDDWLGRFDVVVVDAPCTGSGTLARRPEIMHRLYADDPRRMAALQEEILSNASRTVRPGGRLVYATCSVLPEEGEQVMARFLNGRDFSPALWPTPVDGALFGGALFGSAPLRRAAVAAQAPSLAEVSAPSPAFQLLPLSHGTDGYFVARLGRAGA